MLLQAVALFHVARKEPENQELALSDLARQCANTVFQDNQNTIVGDKEACAREFMSACRDGFKDAINEALTEKKEEPAETLAN